MCDSMDAIHRANQGKGNIGADSLEMELTPKKWLDLAAVKSDLEAKIEQVKCGLFRWMFSAMLAEAGLIVALIRVFRSRPQRIRANAGHLDPLCLVDISDHAGFSAPNIAVGGSIQTISVHRESFDGFELYRLNVAGQCQMAFDPAEPSVHLVKPAVHCRKAVFHRRQAVFHRREP